MCLCITFTCCCLQYNFLTIMAAGVTDEVFDWSSYLTFTGSVAAPRELFRSTVSPLSCFRSCSVAVHVISVFDPAWMIWVSAYYYYGWFVVLSCPT